MRHFFTPAHQVRPLALGMFNPAVEGALVLSARLPQALSPLDLSTFRAVTSKSVAEHAHRHLEAASGTEEEATRDEGE